ncbi:TolC family protein [uncultured Akkermansia sp.]|uniref:TolC family protein n=1 Tax=uncultured Akkermansia sp. TaxID=512294 RepID=UPI0031BB372D
MATAYFNWITACEQLRIAREQLEIQRGTLTIAEKRHTAGFAPRLDVEQATSSVAATESHIPALIAQVASAKNQLSVLLGTYNSRMELTMPKAAVFEKTPVVPVGLPSELLRRRPDVIAAEADLHTAVANVGIAVADLYPRFSLTSIPTSIPVWLLRTRKGRKSSSWSIFIGTRKRRPPPAALRKGVGMILGLIPSQAVPVPVPVPAPVLCLLPPADRSLRKNHVHAHAHAMRATKKAMKTASSNSPLRATPTMNRTAREMPVSIPPLQEALRLLLLPDS